MVLDLKITIQFFKSVEEEYETDLPRNSQKNTRLSFLTGTEKGINQCQSDRYHEGFKD